MPDQPPAATLELAARLRLATARLHRQLRQRAGAGLSASQQSALASIEARGPVTLGELAAIEQVAPPTITRIVDRLADDDLIRRTPDTRDRRVTRVTITAEGRRRLAHSRRLRNAWLAGRLGDLADDDIARLAGAVGALEALVDATPRPVSTPSPVATATATPMAGSRGIPG